MLALPGNESVRSLNALVRENEANEIRQISRLHRDCSTQTGTRPRERYGLGVVVRSRSVLPVTLGDGMQWALGVVSESQTVWLRLRRNATVLRRRNGPAQEDR